MNKNLTKPSTKPSCPNFSSGPCKKRPGYSLAALNTAAQGRSHRSAVGKEMIGSLISKTTELLRQDGLPADYMVGLVPGSDTGAFEMAMWSLLGSRPVTVLHFESFGTGWRQDLVEQLKLNVRDMKAAYGQLPDLSSVDFSTDTVFTWNGTTSGVRVPHGNGAADWIPADRQGLTLCDATSAVFAQSLPWHKLDVTTFSWQKCLGGEGGHGMIVLSPRAVARLQQQATAASSAQGNGSSTQTVPLPKIFRLTKKGKLIKGVFVDSPINTPSMLCVSDFLDALQWALSPAVGGYAGLVARADANLAQVTAFVQRREWIDFLASVPDTRSNTSVCLVIHDLDAAGLNSVTKLLASHGVAYDIASYRDAPVGLRIWCGPTVETADVACLLQWLDWAHDAVKSGSVMTGAAMSIVVTDGLEASAVDMLKKAGHSVTKQKISKEDLACGALGGYDAIILRSGTKLPAPVIEAAANVPGSKLKVIARAGVGVDNVDTGAATKYGIPVLNAPLSATRSVVELALGHLLVSARHIARATADIKGGKWSKKQCVGHELHGKNLGFVGFGRIGQSLARVARVLGMNIHFYDPYLPQPVAEQLTAEVGCVRHSQLTDLFASCTHITVHAMLTQETRHMINYDLVGRMPGVAPDGSQCGNHLISCARGGVVHEADMARALQDGTLRSIALDVFEQEPLKESELKGFSQFSGTPHIGASTIEAQKRVGAEIATALIAFFGGEVPLGNVVNKQVMTAGVGVRPAATSSKL